MILLELRQKKIKVDFQSTISLVEATTSVRQYVVGEIELYNGINVQGCIKHDKIEYYWSLTTSNDAHFLIGSKTCLDFGFND